MKVRDSSSTVRFQEERLFGAANMVKGAGTASTTSSTAQGTQDLRQGADRQPGDPLPSGRTVSNRMPAGAGVPGRAEYIKGQDVTRLASMAKLSRPPGAGSQRQLPAILGRHEVHRVNPVAQAYRDVRLVSISGGADEIMLEDHLQIDGHPAEEVVDTLLLEPHLTGCCM